MLFFLFIYSVNPLNIFFIPVYIACIFLLLYAVYRKYQDKNLLLGIFVSAAFYVIIYVNLFSLLSYLFSLGITGYFLLSFICGIVAGLINDDIKRGALSGMIGMLLAMALTYPYIYFIIFVFGFYFPLHTLPNILGGAVGGALGSKIKKSYSYRKKTIIKPQLDES